MLYTRTHVKIFITFLWIFFILILFQNWIFFGLWGRGFISTTSLIWTPLVPLYRYELEIYINVYVYIHNSECFALLTKGIERKKKRLFNGKVHFYVRYTCCNTYRGQFNDFNELDNKLKIQISLNVVILIVITFRWYYCIIYVCYD